MKMDIEDLTLKQARELARLFGAVSGGGNSDFCDPVIGKYCVVRTYSAGVHVGTVKSRIGRETVLTNAKRIWYWNGANTLHEIASRGIASTSKVSDPVDEILLTEATEFLPCTAAAKEVLLGAKWAK